MRGEIAFEPALRERVALLKGLPAGVVDEVLDKRITLTPGGRDAGRDHARARRLYLRSSPAASRLFTDARRRHDRLPREPRQHAHRRATAS